VTGWLVSRQGLTQDQLRAVELSPEYHRVFTGAPGSGKTLALLHRARHLADAKNVPPERYLILVFTNALSQYIRAALKDLDIPEECVRTFDSWCGSTYREHIWPTAPWDRVNRRIDFAAIRSDVLGHVQAHPSPRLFDFVLVDEGQDLPSDVFAILRCVSWHITVALDRKQNIYDDGAAEAQILTALGIRSRSVSFLEAYRCSPYVASLAKRFVQDGEEREAFGRQAQAAAGKAGQGEKAMAEKEKPLLFIATCPEEESARLAEVVRERLARGEQIAVLVPARRMIRDVSEGLAAKGIPVEVPENRHGTRHVSGLPVLDFATDLAKVMPYHSAKGLTFDTVLLPCLVDSAFRKVDPENLLRLLFVGVTRATTWVYLSTCEGKEHPVLARIGLLEGGPDLIVQDGDPLWEFAEAAGSTATPDETIESGTGGAVLDWL
jgi:superfamily I DNA/RNA helicase